MGICFCRKGGDQSKVYENTLESTDHRLDTVDHLLAVFTVPSPRKLIEPIIKPLAQITPARPPWLSTRVHHLHIIVVNRVGITRRRRLERK
jgi:hypothetical protein